MTHVYNTGYSHTDAIARMPASVHADISEYVRSLSELGVKADAWDVPPKSQNELDALKTLRDNFNLTLKKVIGLEQQITLKGVTGLDNEEVKSITDAIPHSMLESNLQAKVMDRLSEKNSGQIK